MTVIMARAPEEKREKDTRNKKKNADGTPPRQHAPQKHSAASSEHQMNSDHQCRDFPTWYIKATSAINEMDPPLFKRGTNKNRSTPGSLYYSGFHAAGRKSKQKSAAASNRPSSRGVLEYLNGQEPLSKRDDDAGTSSRQSGRDGEHYTQKTRRSPSQTSQVSGLMHLFRDSLTARQSLVSVGSEGPALRQAGSHASQPNGVQMAIWQASHHPPSRVVLARPRFVQAPSVAGRMSHTSLVGRPVRRSAVMSASSVHWTAARGPPIERQKIKGDAPPPSDKQSPPRDQPPPPPTQRKQRSEKMKSLAVYKDNANYSAIHGGSRAGPLPDGRGMSTRMRSDHYLTNREPRSGEYLVRSQFSMTADEAEWNAKRLWRRSTDSHFLKLLRDKNLHDECESSDED